MRQKHQQERSESHYPAEHFPSYWVRTESQGEFSLYWMCVGCICSETSRWHLFRCATLENRCICHFEALLAHTIVVFTWQQESQESISERMRRPCYVSVITGHVWMCVGNIISAGGYWGFCCRDVRRLIARLRLVQCFEFKAMEASWGFQYDTRMRNIIPVQTWAIRRNVIHCGTSHSVLAVWLFHGKIKDQQIRNSKHGSWIALQAKTANQTAGIRRNVRWLKGRIGGR